MVLKHAIIAVLHVTEPVDVNIRTVARGNHPVINQEDWVVRAIPKTGVKLSQKTKKAPSLPCNLPTIGAARSG